MKISSTVAKKTFSYCFLQMWAEMHRKSALITYRFSFQLKSWWIYSSRQNTHKNLRENELTVTLVQLQLSLAPAELANTRERSCTCSSAAVLAAPEKRSVWRPLPSLASLGIFRQQHTMVFYIFLFTILNFRFSLSPCFYGKKNNILRRQNEWA